MEEGRSNVDQIGEPGAAEIQELEAVGMRGLPDVEGDQTEPSIIPETAKPRLVEAEMEGLRQRVEARETEIAALQAELASARQEQEGELAALRSALAEAQRGRIEAYRRALLAEHAGQIVDEMVTGETLEELDASVDIARATYGRALEAARRELSTSLAPIGASPRMAPSSDELSPIAKITAALGRR